jgi:hypothetical protein
MNTNNIGWISLASCVLLACNNPAPAADAAETAGSAATLASQQRSCELAEHSQAVNPEQTRGLYAAGEQAPAQPALTNYAGTCGGALAGSYALQVDLDVFMQDESSAAEHDPGRGHASLWLRADIGQSNAAELHERAFTLSSLETVPFDDLLERAFCAGAAHYAAGQLEQSVQYFDRAAEIARTHQEHEAVAQAVGAASFVLRGTLMFDRDRHRQIREALRALPEGDCGIKAILLPAGSLGEHSPGALAQRRAAAHAGIAMARRLGDSMVLAQTLSTCHHTLWGAAHPSELLEISKRDDRARA